MRYQDPGLTPESRYGPGRSMTAQLAGAPSAMASGNNPMKMGAANRGQNGRTSPLMTALPCGGRICCIGGGSRRRCRYAAGETPTLR